MKQKTYHIWMLIGVCIFKTLTVDTLDFEKIKNRNHLGKLSIFERAYPSIASAGGHVQDVSSSHDISTLNKLQKRDNETEPIERKENKTKQIQKSEIKNIESKFYNKKRLLHPSKLEDKSHAKRENFFFRLFSDNYKPHKQRSLIKKKRDSNGIIRKLEIVNDTMFPPISHSALPLSQFGRDRKLNDDKICKTQIIKFFPKQMRKSFETKNDIGNESHRQLMFNDNNNNEWGLRQDIFVEEILPFREKNDFGFKDIFHDETKNIFDDILSIFTMLPFSIFDTIYVKLTTTEKPKISEPAESGYEEATYLTDNFRNKRQAAGGHDASKLLPVVNDNSVIKDGSTDNIPSEGLSNSKSLLPNVGSDSSIVNISSEGLKKSNTNVMGGEVVKADANEALSTNKQVNEAIIDSTNAASKDSSIVIDTSSEGLKESNTNLMGGEVVKADVNEALTSNEQVNRANVIESEVKTTFTESKKMKTATDTEKLNKFVASSQYELNNSTEVSSSTSTVAELSKQKLLSPKDVELLEMSDNERDHYDENLKNAENVEEAEPSNDKNAFLMVLGVIPGLVGLIIAVGVVGIWMIQKNSSWVERNNQGNEPTTSSQTKPPHSMNI